jgi:hypothetical protein|tara:strand:+ start:245 stop:490 length:246 start_codon:yes stop_codon:yes gene_type:complete
MNTKYLKIENSYIGDLDLDRVLFSYTDAVNYLFEYLKDDDKWGWMKKEYPKSEFIISISGINLETLKMSKLRKLEKLGIKF